MNKFQLGDVVELNYDAIRTYWTSMGLHRTTSENITNSIITYYKAVDRPLIVTRITGPYGYELNNHPRLEFHETDLIPICQEQEKLE